MLEKSNSIIYTPFVADFDTAVNAALRNAGLPKSPFKKINFYVPYN